MRTSNTILCIALAKNSPYNTIREFTEAARANPGKFNSGLVPGLTEFTFWAYLHHEKLDIRRCRTVTSTQRPPTSRRAASGW